jgi:hypothetical protein
MMWLERVDANRAATLACWLGTTVLARSWQRRIAAIAAALQPRREAAARVRLAPVSREWLQQHAADCAKHEPAR